MYTLAGMLLFQKTENPLKSLEYPCNLANVYLRVREYTQCRRKQIPRLDIFTLKSN